MTKPTRWIALLTFAAALAFLVSCSTRTAAPPQASPQIETVLREVREKHNLPALFAVVVRSDSLEAAAVGIRRIGHPEEVTLNDLVHIGSNAKSMTATLATLLVEEGALSWEMTLGEAFPDLRVHSDYARVTLKQLLAHMAGLPPMTDDAEFVSVPELTGPPTEQRRAFAAWLLEQAPASASGTFTYSNASYAVAALLIESKMGTPWEMLIQKRLFQPLGMDVAFGWPTVRNAEQPWGHVRGENGQLELAPESYQLGPALRPAGDISLSILDYGRYLQAHLRGLRGMPGLLRPESFRLLHEPLGGNGTGTGYGLGWGVGEIEGIRTSGHSGSAGTFYARAIVQPARDLAVAVVMNAGHEAADGIAREVIRELIRLEALTPGPSPSGRVTSSPGS